MIRQSRFNHVDVPSIQAHTPHGHRRMQVATGGSRAEAWCSHKLGGRRRRVRSLVVVCHVPLILGLPGDPGGNKAPSPTMVVDGLGKALAESGSRHSGRSPDGSRLDDSESQSDSSSVGGSKPSVDASPCVPLDAGPCRRDGSIMQRLRPRRQAERASFIPRRIQPAVPAQNGPCRLGPARLGSARSARPARPDLLANHRPDLRSNRQGPHRSLSVRPGPPGQDRPVSARPDRFQAQPQMTRRPATDRPGPT